MFNNYFLINKEMVDSRFSFENSPLNRFLSPDQEIISSLDITFKTLAYLIQNKDYNLINKLLVHDESINTASCLLIKDQKIKIVKNLYSEKNLNKILLNPVIDSFFYHDSNLFREIYDLIEGIELKKGQLELKSKRNKKEEIKKNPFLDLLIEDKDAFSESIDYIFFLGKRIYKYKKMMEISIEYDLNLECAIPIHINGIQNYANINTKLDKLIYYIAKFKKVDETQFNSPFNILPQALRGNSISFLIC